MTPKTIVTVVLAGVALVVGAQAASAGPTPDAMREDGFDRAVAAAKLQQWMAEDGFDRAVAAKRALQSTPRLSPDTRERIEAATQRKQSPGLTHSDSVEGALVAASHPASPAVSTTSSGGEIEWPQVGIGFGLGLFLALALYLAVRLTRARELAH